MKAGKIWTPKLCNTTAMLLHVAVELKNVTCDLDNTSGLINFFLLIKGKPMCFPTQPMYFHSFFKIFTT